MAAREGGEAMSVESHEVIVDILGPVPEWSKGEIVRCRDCRWISKDTKHYKACYRLPDCEFMVEPDGFCWKGERNV